MTGSSLCRWKWTSSKLENTNVCRNCLKYKLKIDIIISQCLPLHPCHITAKLLRYICSTEGVRVTYLSGCHWSCSHTGEVLGIGEKNVHFNPFGEKKSTRNPMLLGLVIFQKMLAPTGQNNRFVAKIEPGKEQVNLFRDAVGNTVLGSDSSGSHQIHSQLSRARGHLSIADQPRRGIRSQKCPSNPLLPRNLNLRRAWCTHSKCFTKFYVV